MSATHSRDAFVPFLSGSIGVAASDALIVRVCRELHLDEESFTIESALSVCERIAQEPGLTGIAGRFAKTRLILAWGRPKDGAR